mgnify:CR=1 FL=1
MKTARVEDISFRQTLFYCFAFILTGSALGVVFHRNPVKSALFLTKALRPLLEASTRGVVLNITAAGAQAPMAGIGAYCASKAALVNLTRTLAKEWTPLGIRVNALTPGSTATDMILPVDAEKRARFVAEMAAQNPMNRIAEPAEIARAARFLVSDAASYVTGHVLVVDGGLLA